MSQQHNHITRDVKPIGDCPACDEARFKPTISSTPGAPLEVTIETSDNAGPDELMAAIEAAAREAGLL